MANIFEITTKEQWEEIFQNSSDRKAYILKYNPNCIICEDAFKEYKKFYESYNKGDADFYFVNVIEDKSVSKAIANELEVTHQSPQLIIVKDQDSVWCDNHKDIELQNIQIGSTQE